MPGYTSGCKVSCSTSRNSPPSTSAALVEDDDASAAAASLTGPGCRSRFEGGFCCGLLHGGITSVDGRWVGRNSSILRTVMQEIWSNNSQRWQQLDMSVMNQEATMLTFMTSQIITSKSNDRHWHFGAQATSPGTLPPKGYRQKPHAPGNHHPDPPPTNFYYSSHSRGWCDEAWFMEAPAQTCDPSYYDITCLRHTTSKSSKQKQGLDQGGWDQRFQVQPSYLCSGTKSKMALWAATASSASGPQDWSPWLAEEHHRIGFTPITSEY